jgi:DNA-binding MarR family transcriptional regulator
MSSRDYLIILAKKKTQKLREAQNGRYAFGEINYHTTILPLSFLRDKSLTSAEFRVLSLINAYQNEKGYACPSQASLAKMINCNVSTVAKIIKNLEAKDYIKSDFLKGHFKCYIVIHPNAKESSHELESDAVENIASCLDCLRDDAWSIEL